MRHPQIHAGRGGLPRTSNVPWSADEEKYQRIYVWIDCLFMWILAAFTIYSIATRVPWWFVGMCCAFVWVAFLPLRRDRRILYAMLLNKPRSLEGLTQWTEHP